MELGLCDFIDVVNDMEMHKDQTLARKYFHHLIDVVEYLHSAGVAYLDLKPDNLLLSRQMTLKISDFDVSFKEGDKERIKKITPIYGAPELNSFGEVRNYYLADIFSLGIILFNMVTGDSPFEKNTKEEREYILKELRDCPEKFWKCQKARGNLPGEFDEDFCEVFEGLTRLDPLKRYHFGQIKRSKWYRKKIYDPDDLKTIMT